MRKWLRVGFVCLVAACDYWSLQINADGLLLVTVIGDDRLSDRGYRLRTRYQGGATRTVNVPASGRVSFRSPETGPLELTLFPPEGCRVSPPNPRTVMVAVDEETTVAFDVKCNS
jgi:hypothetical protein